MMNHAHFTHIKKHSHLGIFLKKNLKKKKESKRKNKKKTTSFPLTLSRYIG